MRQGDFTRAWHINDAVLARRDPKTRDDTTLPYHQRWVWNGTPLAKRNVLVRCYHGLGDTLQFARFIPQAASIAASLTIEAQPELCETLAIFAPLCRITPFDVANPLPPLDCDIEIMELAHALRITDVAKNAAYLQPARTQATSNQPAAIGICWQSGNWDQDRNVPPAKLLDAIEPLSKRPTSLQRGVPYHPNIARRLANPTDLSTSVTDTTALIENLDLVITVDSFVAHLAGALGKPAYVLLKKNADWRWMTGKITAWYPNATLFRQSSPGTWDQPLADLKRSVAQGSKEAVLF